MAYLITFTTYGTRLHGDPRGSVDRRHNLVGTPLLAPSPVRQAAALAKLNFAPCVLDAPARRVVDETIREVCAHKHWKLLALNVRTNHVHLLVAANAEPGAVMASIKAWATRRLTEAGLIPPGRSVWTTGGSKRRLWRERDVEIAWDYVVHGQGVDLD